MNGIHDLGGMDGFGPVEMEANEPVFHQPWETRVFGLVAAIAAQRVARTGEFRHAIERMDPLHYLGSLYYEHWLTGAATLLVEKGRLTREELAARAGGSFPLSRRVDPGVTVVAEPSGAAPRFAVGSSVVVRNIHPLGHTRCPRYVRGKRGIVVRIDPASSLPDVGVHSDQPCKQHVYCVRFEGRELWGESAPHAEAVHVDLWESYLEAQ